MSLRLLIRDHPTRALAVIAETHALIFRHSDSLRAQEQESNVTSPPDGVSKCLVEFSASCDLSGYRVLRASGVHGTLGLINIGKNLFLCLISGAVRVATVRPNETVQQILSVEFYCLNSGDYDAEYQGEYDPYSTDSANYHSHTLMHGEEAALEHPCHELKRMLSSGTFYYSVDFDLTNRLQDRLSEESAFDIDSLDPDYLWNQCMINPLIKFRARLAKSDKENLDSSRILTSAVRGFVSTITVSPAAAPIKSIKTNLPSALTLISRLSCRRAGTRFNSRGIDDDGNVANFVETETIFWHPSGLCFSYAQVRGSVPLFWEQATGLLPGQQKIHITRSAEATQPAFNKHIESLEVNYGTVQILNLLSDSKPGEAELTSRYKHHVLGCPLNQVVNLAGTPGSRLQDVQFDFHAETRGGGYDAAGAVRGLVQNQAESFAYLLCEEAPNRNEKGNLPENVVILQQEGVFRTNCLDCLDRTNLIQTILSQMAIELFLHHRAATAMADFWTRHSTLWADNGDALSKIYAGTGALKSSFTRHGKMNLAGAIADARKSATRLYMNNFVDKSRQNTIDMLLGRLMDQYPVHLYDPITDHVDVELKKRLKEYSISESIHIWVGTFNLNGKSEGVQYDLTSWLCPETTHAARRPEIVSVGFQEIVELSPQQIMSTDPVRRQAWEHAVRKTLNKNSSSSERYVLLRSGQLVGTALMIFVKSSALNSIKNVEGSVKKTGMSGMAGNKGAVAIRMDYANTRLCFVTAHLAAGFVNYEERNRDYRTISHGLRFQRNRSIEDHDAIIWAGDFNYRIGLSDDKVRRFANAGDLDTLYQNDQLNLQMVAGRTFPYYSESRIPFMPTYRYDNGTDVYDTSEKARIPAWCDRVLKKGDILKQIDYATAPLRFSDHRPVYATFQCTISVIDDAKKEKLSQEIYAQRRAEVGGNTANARNDDIDGEEDFVGYDAISPELPPASSDRRKWWLDGGLPARSNPHTPSQESSLNGLRPKNPFTPTREPDWITLSGFTHAPRRTDDASGGNAGAGPDVINGGGGGRLSSSFGTQGALSVDKSGFLTSSSLGTKVARSRDSSLGSHIGTASGITLKSAPPIPKKPDLLSNPVYNHSSQSTKSACTTLKSTTRFDSPVKAGGHPSYAPVGLPPTARPNKIGGEVTPSSALTNRKPPHGKFTASREFMEKDDLSLLTKIDTKPHVVRAFMDDEIEGASAIPSLQPQRRG